MLGPAGASRLIPGRRPDAARQGGALNGKALGVRSEREGRTATQEGSPRHIWNELVRKRAPVARIGSVQFGRENCGESPAKTGPFSGVSSSSVRPVVADLDPDFDGHAPRGQVLGGGVGHRLLERCGQLVGTLGGDLEQELVVHEAD